MNDECSKVIKKKKKKEPSLLSLLSEKYSKLKIRSRDTRHIACITIIITNYRFVVRVLSFD